MCCSRWEFVLIALLTLTVGDIMGTVQAEDTMPPTIDIVPKLRTRAKNEFISAMVRIDSFPVPNFYIRGSFGEEKGHIFPIVGANWSLRAMPGVLPDNRFFQVGSTVMILHHDVKGPRFPEGMLIPLCGHVYRFSRKEKAGLLTLLPDHPLQFQPKDKARYFSVTGSFKWGEELKEGADRAMRGDGGYGFYESLSPGEDGRMYIIRYTTLSKSETAAVVEFNFGEKYGHKDLDEVLKYKLEKAVDKRGGHILKVNDHIKTDEFDFVVRRIIAPDGKDNPGWIDLELLTGAQEAQDK